jgi:FkbM family methyltransferase
MENIIEKAGVKFYANTELEKWRAESILEKEPETIAWINSFSAKAKVFYDIGANVGSYAIYAGSVNPKLDVYAFEPVWQNYCALLKNIQLNNLVNIHAFRAALSVKNKLTEIFLQDTRVGNSGAQIDAPINERGIRFQEISSQQVMTLSLNSLVNDFCFPKPNFVKIDVDGHEKDVIEGMSEILKTDSLLSILVEFNTSAELLKFTNYFAQFQFAPDPIYNNYPSHSNYRRKEKKGTAINYVFTKK